MIELDSELHPLIIGQLYSRFNFNFRPTESHRSNSQQQQRPKSPYLNYAGRPIYKNHRKYPYYG